MALTRLDVRMREQLGNATSPWSPQFTRYDLPSPSVEAVNLVPEGEADAVPVLGLLSFARSYVFASDVLPLIDDERAHVRRVALFALGALDRWAALIGALKLARDPAEEVRAASELVMQRWRTAPAEVYRGPARELASELEQLLNETEPQLQWLVENVRLVLRGLQ